MIFMHKMILNAKERDSVEIFVGKNTLSNVASTIL